MRERGAGRLEAEEGRKEDSLEFGMSRARGAQDEVAADSVRADLRRKMFGTDVAPRTVGRYTLSDRLGSGGMGVVYLAHDPELDREVAIKLLPPLPHHRLHGAKMRLVREARALAQLSHPNVVPIHDVGESDGRLYLVMERLHGRDLATWCREVDPTWQQVVEVFRQAGKGLAAAHRRGIVHRDFKPTNVLVDAEGIVRVLDFGLATSTGSVGRSASTTQDADDTIDRTTELTRESSSMTGTGWVLGTPAYMAPEQHAGGTATERTDIYAFCVALHECLCGHRPFEGNDGAELAANKAREAIVECTEPATGAPRWLVRIVRTGLRASPAQRPASIDALLSGIERRTTARKQRRSIVLGLGGALGIAAVAVGWREPSDTCMQEGRETLDEVWNPRTRARIVERFAAHPFGVDTASRATTDLDAYVESWKSRTRSRVRHGRPTHAGPRPRLPRSAAG